MNNYIKLKWSYDSDVVNTITVFRSKNLLDVDNLPEPYDVIDINSISDEYEYIDNNIEKNTRYSYILRVDADVPTYSSMIEVMSGNWFMMQSPIKLDRVSPINQVESTNNVISLKMSVGSWIWASITDATPVSANLIEQYYEVFIHSGSLLEAGNNTCIGISNNTSLTGNSGTGGRLGYCPTGSIRMSGVYSDYADGYGLGDRIGVGIILINNSTIVRFYKNGVRFNDVVYPNSQLLYPFINVYLNNGGSTAEAMLEVTDMMYLPDGAVMWGSI